MLEQEKFNDPSNFRDPLRRSFPYHGIFYGCIPVSKHIPHADNAMEVWNSTRCKFINSAETVQCLPKNFKLTFNR